MDPEEQCEFDLKLRIPLWCKNPLVKVNGSELADKPVTGTFFTITRKWKMGDEIQLFFPMEYRLVNGRGQQWEKVALMRGPVVYGISNDLNPFVVETGELIIDPGTLSDFVEDNSFRPGGLKCTAILANEKNTKLTFTEFIDPTGIKTFFRLSERSDLVEEDEFVLKQY